MNPGILTQGTSPVLLPGGLLGSPTPIAMPDQAWHPEALDWRNRVRANGGDASHQTMAAVNRFCTDIDAAGLRDRFYRVNLFCGSNLSACLVPLYRSTVRDGAVLGNATDTNSNFVSADYVEYGNPFGGLKGNGSNKALDTGVNPVTIGAVATSHHLAVYVRGTESSSRVMISNASADGSATSALGFFKTEERYIGAVLGIVSATTGGRGLEGLLCGTTIADQTGISTLLNSYYRNGSLVAFSRSTGTNFTNASFRVFSATGGLFSLARYFRAYSIGRGLSLSDAWYYAAAMQRFQAALGRSV